MSRHFDLMQEIEREQARRAKHTTDSALPLTSKREMLNAGPTANPDLSLLTLVMEHWRLISVCACRRRFLSALVTMVIPKKYASEVQFLVKNERKDLTITPAQNAQSPQVSGLSEEEVNSEMQMLLSHDLLEGVVLDNHLYKTKPGEASSAPDRRTIELGVMKLRNNLDVSAIRKTNVIQAKYRATSPDLAAKVLEDLSSRYLNAHLAAHSTPGSYGFFASELARFRGTWIRLN